MCPNLSSLILCSKNTEHLRSWYVGTCLAGELQIRSVSMDFQRKKSHQFVHFFQDMKFQMDSQIRKLDDPVSLPGDALKSELDDLKKQVLQKKRIKSHDYIKIHKVYTALYCYICQGCWGLVKSMNTGSLKSWSLGRQVLKLERETSDVAKVQDQKCWCFCKLVAVMRLLRMIIVLEVLDVLIWIICHQ